jgi:starch synthase (maltosyl-transferring)
VIPERPDVRAKESRERVVIEAVYPEIDGGRFPIKRTVGERVVVEADAFTDGHDLLTCALGHRRNDQPGWTWVPMVHVVNDRWRAEFPVEDVGVHRYTIKGWVDRFGSWRRDLEKKAAAGQDIDVELLSGAELVERAAGRARGRGASTLRQFARRLRTSNTDSYDSALDEDLAGLMAAYPDEEGATSYERELTVVVDRERARFSSWYEMFPRSASAKPGRHGTFRDVEARLPYVADMGFDVLYLPPIHPIGYTNRKGKNNKTSGGQADVGSPWAIGSGEGGHTAIHPELGTFEDFDRLRAKAADLGLEIAMDLAFQCSPDHPWVKTNPEWFRYRPDGTVQYAENPPKKYQDIYPLDFETENWQELWDELERVVRFWIDRGIRIFRVDNPHTKPLAFWEWLLERIRADHPDVVFLSEAFTRPKVMYRLAKLGFNQSYTYFAWRNQKWELEQYLDELTRTEVREYFRPHLWPNTPDILTDYLQSGGRPAFLARLVLAATLGASYGIYGPAFELSENRALAPGSEEYLDSEKYEIRNWDISREDSLAPLIGLVNRIRRESPELHANDRLRFHQVDNDQLIAYSKTTEDNSGILVVVVNLDPYHVQSGWLRLPLEELSVDPTQTYQMHDLLSDARYFWHGHTNYVELNPHVLPAHVFRVRRRIRTEEDFETYQ